MHVSDISYTGLHSRGRCMSQTCLTLTLVSMPMSCPRHGLTLTLIMWSMHVPDVSDTSTQITRMSWHEYPNCFLRFKQEFYYLNIHLSNHFHNQEIHAISI
ncbi:hypothetical protein V6Z11_A05G374100 [Gossypium hirsutum]